MTDEIKDTAANAAAPDAPETPADTTPPADTAPAHETKNTPAEKPAETPAPEKPAPAPASANSDAASPDKLAEIDDSAKEDDEDDTVYTTETDEPVYDERALAETYQATGRRKRSVARVIVSPGNGTITINKRPVENYFPGEIFQQILERPLDLTRLKGRFNITCNVHGGGFSGQAGAVRHGISRALSLIDDKTRHRLKVAGMLTRDSRQKERKKYGKRGARASFQFSKR